MGYYTVYGLEIVKGGKKNINYEQEISELSGYEDECFGEPIKWYNYDKDMTEYSLKHPDVLFKITGKGEDAGDLWYHYFMNGKSQHIQAKITFEKFSKSKLK